MTVPVVFTLAARILVGLALLLCWQNPAIAVGDPTATAVPETPTAKCEGDLEFYRKAVQEVTAAEVEYRKNIEAASDTLVEYQKVVKAAADAGRAEPNAIGAAQAKILELVSAAGLAVAAIFFGFLGVIVAPMPGLPVTSEAEKQVKDLYWKMAHANAAGVALSMSASVCAMVALGTSSSCCGWWAIALGALAVCLVVGITAYLDVKMWQPNWGAGK